VGAYCSFTGVGVLSAKGGGNPYQPNLPFSVVLCFPVILHSCEQLDMIPPSPRRDERQKTQMIFTVGTGGAPHKYCCASSAVVQQGMCDNQMSPQLFVAVATHST